MKKGNGVLILFLLIGAALLVFLFPTITDYFRKLNTPKIPKVEEPVEEKKEVDAEVLENLVYPIMRDSAYSDKTYFSLDSFSISDMSNEDILYNAFMDLYEGYIVNSSYSGDCTNIAKEFEAKYMSFRIKNILGKNLKYTFSDFYVPEDANSSYTGTWVYDSSRNVFRYKGLCESKKSNTKYYDLKEFIKAEYDEYDLIVHSYVGFAKVVDGNYTIYSDAAMTKEIASGIGDGEVLENAFKSVNAKEKKIYKFTFKIDICSYGDYCLYKGEWVNEL